MRSFRDLINLVEGVVQFSDHQREPENMTPDVRVGSYVIHAAKKFPESRRYLDYIVWIEGPDRSDPEDHIDIRRYAGPEPEKMTGLPEIGGVEDFTKFADRANTLADYGVEKPPEVRNNPEWVLWRKKAILKMAERYGLA